MEERKNKRPDSGRRPTSDRQGDTEEVRSDRPRSARPQTARETLRRQAAAKARRRRRRNAILRVLVVAVLIIAALGGALYWTKYGPSKDKADLKEYYGIENENQLAVIVDNQRAGAGAVMIDGRVYIEYKTVRDNINQRFYLDQNENILLYTLPTEMVSAAIGSSDYTVGNEPRSAGYPIWKMEGDTAYIALDFVQQYTNLDYKTYDDAQPRVMVVTQWGEITVASIKKDTQVRYQAGVKSPVLREMSKKEQVTVIGNEGSWKKIRTEDGFIGYVENSCLKDAEKKTVTREFTEPEYTSLTSDRTINLGWNMVTNDTANSAVLETIANTKGLTVISPTWFSVGDTAGNLISIANAEYVNYAHQSGIQVWAMVNDFDHGFGGLTTADEISEVLKYTSKRNNLINQIISNVIQFGIDGVNVDFEHIYTEELGYHYIQFIRELSVKCRQNKIILSVDNYVPQGYNEQYHRAEQGVMADYLIIMGYDEHQSNSYESGSVASYDFVKQGIEDTIAEVPAGKVINAVPFYTRLWTERPKTDEEKAADSTTEAGKYDMKISCQTIGMADAQQAIADAGASAAWDEKTRQNYAEWTTADGQTAKIWLEDARSIEEKLKLMKEYQLAGTAAWRIGYETADIWDLIQRYVN